MNLNVEICQSHQHLFAFSEYWDFERREKSVFFVIASRSRKMLMEEANAVVIL